MNSRISAFVATALITVVPTQDRSHLEQPAILGRRRPGPCPVSRTGIRTCREIGRMQR
jgi:hypothetical protein